ncbi:MAG: hypothetical protein ACI8TF_000179 [Paracoccaceae bacterium]|jgi:hypothetical protein
MSHSTANGLKCIGNVQLLSGISIELLSLRQSRRIPLTLGRIFAQLRGDEGGKPLIFSLKA